MAGVQVTFGANIDKLVEGVGQVKSSIDSIGSSLTHVAELFGVAFSAEGVKSFIESMAQLGLSTQRTATSLGLSNQKVIELSGFAKLTGSDIDTLSTGIERMSLNIQKSTKDDFNPAAQALKLLGLNARDLVGLPTDQYFEKLADAVSKFNPSLNLTNALMAIGGRGISQMVPSLLQGGDAFREMREQVAQASEGLAAAVPGMADTHEKLTLLGISAQSFGARIFSVLKPAIDQAVVSITQWLQSIKSTDIQSVFNEIVSTLGSAAVAIANFFITATEDWEKFVSSINSGLPAVHAGAAGILTITGQLGAAWDQIKQAWAGATGGEPFSAIEARASAAREQVQSLVTSIQSIVTGARGGGGAFAGEPSSGPTGGGQDIGAINVGALNAARAAQQQYQAMIAQATGAYAVLKGLYSTDVAVHRTTVDEETANLQSALAERWSIEQALFDKEKSLYAESTPQYTAVLKAQQVAYQQYLKEHQALTDTQLKADVQEWSSMLSPFVGAWNSQLRGLLAGTESWSTAWRKILGDMIVWGIEQLERFAVEQAALGLASSLHAGPQSLLGGLLGGGPQAAATAANTTALVALQAALDANTVALGGETAATTAAAGASAASSGGGFLSGFSSLFSLLGFAGFAAGTDYVASSGLALIHKGEAVVPAQANTPFTGANLGGGGSDVVRALGKLGKMHVESNAALADTLGQRFAGMESEITSLRRALAKSR